MYLPVYSSSCIYLKVLEVDTSLWGEWYLSPYLPIIGPDEDFILNMKFFFFFFFLQIYYHTQPQIVYLTRV